MNHQLSPKVEQHHLHYLHYDGERGILIVDDALLRSLSFPPFLKIVSAADGLILTSWEEGLDAGGDQVERIIYDHEDIDEPHIALAANDAQQLGISPSRRYIAWIERWSESIYAVPEAEPTAPAADQVVVTIHLMPQEVQILEQLALTHDVRMADILTAMACDLAAEHADGDERYAMRSGGSDERMLANEWFNRNVMPAWGDQKRPEFVRRFSGLPDAQGGEL